MDKVFDKEKRRALGIHLTPISVFKEFILPEIYPNLYNYLWVDLFAGKGNLIFPILDEIPRSERVEFFENHIRLFDIQEEMVEYMRNKAIKEYGIPKSLAKRNIKKRDNLENFPQELLDEKFPIYHITNPPYLYIGFIRKNIKKYPYQKYLSYFSGERQGLQDLYQIALYNDLRAGLKKMIYIIPTNFIYGKSGANEIRKRLFPFYSIDKLYILEEKLFNYTGVNVGIFFFIRKETPNFMPISFPTFKKEGDRLVKEELELKREFNYTAGNYFEEFVRNNKNNNLKVRFYLMKEEVLKNKGSRKVILLNANRYNKSSGTYAKEIYYVNDKLYKKIKNNILWIRTIDTGTETGRAGLYRISDLGVDGILTEKPYRTHPIQIFFEPEIPTSIQLYLREKFNETLEDLRSKTNSSFMTTYKYSSGKYVRKYLGLTQAKKIISTIPL